MKQHEKLVKDAHDFLEEASEQFKSALTKQVRMMERHNDRHEVLKESTEELATTARKRFRDITLGEDTSKDASTGRKNYAESLLAQADEEHKKTQAGWMEERMRRSSAWRRNMRSSRRIGRNLLTRFPNTESGITEGAKNGLRRKLRSAGLRKKMRHFERLLYTTTE
jgi:hypothetical protein